MRARAAPSDERRIAEDDPVADELVSVCPEAVRFCRAFRSPAPLSLPFHVEQVRLRFVTAGELLVRLREAEPSARSEVTAAIEIAERGRSVADIRWIVGHVLQYGPDAEVLEPEGVRRRVRGAVEGLVG